MEAVDSESFPTIRAITIPQILIHILSYCDTPTLATCMRVSYEFYDLASKDLWSHVNYRKNRFLTGPGVSPFIAIPKHKGLGGLRRAKRRAMRYIRVIEVRVHDCEEVGCGELSLHDEMTDDEGDPSEFRVGTSTTTTTTTNIVRLEDEIFTKTISPILRFHVEDHVSRSVSSITTTSKLSTPHHLLPLCPFINRLDTPTMVIVPLQHLATRRISIIPYTFPSLTKLIILLIPPVAGPDRHRLAEGIPSTINHIVIYLWNRHGGAAYEYFSGRWTRGMKGKGWGPDRIWNHWCNFIMTCSELNKVDVLEPMRSEDITTSKRVKYTFVGTGKFDSEWLDMTGEITLEEKMMLNDSEQGLTEDHDKIKYQVIQSRFERGFKATLFDKWIDGRRGQMEGNGAAVQETRSEFNKWYSKNIQFLSREEYLSLGGWEGEFTMDEIMYHG